jgi:hypothetical protein
MRQREITWQGWRVSWPDVDGGRHSVYEDEHEDADREAEALREAGKVADVRVRPVTRYRLAPLVEIAAWRYASGDAFAGNHITGVTADVVNTGNTWTVHVRAGGASPTFVQVQCRNRKAAMAAAKAHLAVLGYRVAKEKRR